MELRNKLDAFLQNIASFFKSPSHNRTLAIIGIIILAAVIPVTVIVLQQQTNLQQHAYIPPEPGGGAACLNKVGQYVGTTITCCGVNQCRPVYRDIYCGIVQKVVATNVRACGYSPAPKYSCVVNHLSKTAAKDASYPNDLWQDSNGKTGYCGTNQYCSDNGAWQTSTSGVCHDLVASSCSCASNNNPFNTNFTCNGGFVKRVCGAGLMCSNEHKGAQSGLWPCVTATSVPKAPTETNVACGTTATPGQCYWNATKTAFLAMSCDPDAYTRNLQSACGDGQVGSSSTLPSCDTMVKSVTGKSGSQNLSAYDSKCTNHTQSQGAGVVGIGRCCSVYLAPVTPTPPNSGCSDFSYHVSYQASTCQAEAAQYAPTCKTPQGYNLVNKSGDYQCVYTSFNSSCTSTVGTCQKYQCGAGQNVAMLKNPDGSSSTYSCTQGPEYVCCAKADSNKIPVYTCITPKDAKGNIPSTGNSFSGTDGSVTNCPTGKLCAQGASYPTAGGFSAAVSHLCIVNASSAGGNICKGANGSCVLSHSSCPNGTSRNLPLDIGCGATSGTVCCTPSDTSGGSGGSNGGGTGGGGGGGSCTNGKTTKFAMDITLPGIGTGTFDNHIPKHLTRHAAIYVKDSSGNAIVGQSRSFTFAINHKSGNGPLQIGTFDLQTKLVCGKTYYVYVKVPGYLTIKQVLTYGSSTQTFAVSAVPGDIASAGTDNMLTPDGNLAGDDKVTIADYNVVRTCRNVDPNTVISFTSGSTKINAKCSDLMNYFDYADGGTQGDEWAFNYNLWLRGFLKANGL